MPCPLYSENQFTVWGTFLLFPPQHVILFALNLKESRWYEGGSRQWSAGHGRPSSKEDGDGGPGTCRGSPSFCCSFRLSLGRDCHLHLLKFWAVCSPALQKLDGKSSFDCIFKLQNIFLKRQSLIGILKGFHKN